MNIKDILAKIARGEALTDEEKSFAGGYDPQEAENAAAAKARRKAEGERDEWRKKAEQATALAEENAAKLKTPDEKDTELARLAKRLEKLEGVNKALEAEKAATIRTASIREAMKNAGITAARGVDPDTLQELISARLKDTDLEDADAVKTVFDTFKKSNPSMIAAGGFGGVGVKGTPGTPAFAKNPWKKSTFNLTEQIELSVKDPERAAAMKAEAENENTNP